MACAGWRLARTGAPWRLRPHDFPRGEAVDHPTQRWLRAGRVAAIAQDLRLLVRLAAGRSAPPRAVILDARTVPSTPESGADAGDGGHNRRTGRQVHLAVATLGHLLAAVRTPASEQERAPVAELAARVQDVTGQTVERAWVDQGDTGDEPAAAAAAQGSQVAVVKLPAAEGPQRGLVSLPRRWGVEGTQSQYLQCALDVQAARPHDRARWVAQPA
jgi:transposase